ncbi:hypothetical protein EII31_05400 [Leucobacter sp. OH2974_COT-288]|uniref:Siderophore-interacting protein C-terminal domain-containing protein n=1 Tax=Canibacter oris TaxID=1365628 RepID=A0A840DPZ4_9MICO|nr:hypothetical protein [Canibacter oris]MBB4072187.1 hypothetical protein [Canibacter oris]RRD35773.1 hypothetical protein EII31_05400 [Leucobacter sp. OH2974_COT-288]
MGAEESFEFDLPQQVGEAPTLVLAAGDAGDLAELQLWLQGFATPVFGAVFLEVFAPHQQTELWLPAGVSCTWLCRETSKRGYLPGWGKPRGLALREAVSSWLAEWAPHEETGEIHVWAGAQSSSIMRSYWLRVEREFMKSRNRQERYV